MILTIYITSWAAKTAIAATMRSFMISEKFETTEEEEDLGDRYSEVLSSE